MSEKKSLGVLFGVVGIALGAIAGAVVTFFRNKDRVFYIPGIAESKEITISRMVELAKKLGNNFTVELKRNGTRFVVVPDMTVGDAHARWNRLFGERSRKEFVLT